MSLRKFAALTSEIESVGPRHVEELSCGLVGRVWDHLTPISIQLGSCQNETESLQVIQSEESLGDTEQKEFRSKQIYHSEVDC